MNVKWLATPIDALPAHQDGEVNRFLVLGLQFLAEVPDCQLRAVGVRVDLLDDSVEELRVGSHLTGMAGVVYVRIESLRRTVQHYNARN